MYKNNPYNIKSAKTKRPGQIGSRNGYCLFKDEYYGILNFAMIVRNYMEHGLDTPEKIIRTYLYCDPGLKIVEFITDVSNYARLISDLPILSDDQFLRFLESVSKKFGNFVPHAKIYEVLFYMKFRYPSNIGL